MANVIAIAVLLIVSASFGAMLGFILCAAICCGKMEDELSRERLEATDVTVGNTYGGEL